MQASPKISLSVWTEDHLDFSIEKHNALPFLSHCQWGREEEVDEDRRKRKQNRENEQKKERKKIPRLEYNSRWVFEPVGLSQGKMIDKINVVVKLWCIFIFHQKWRNNLLG